MPVALRRDPKVNVGALEGGEKVHELFLWGKRGPQAEFSWGTLTPLIHIP